MILRKSCHDKISGRGCWRRSNATSHDFVTAYNTKPTEAGHVFRILFSFRRSYPVNTTNILPSIMYCQERNGEFNLVDPTGVEPAKS